MRQPLLKAGRGRAVTLVPPVAPDGPVRDTALHRSMVSSISQRISGRIGQAWPIQGRGRPRRCPFSHRAIQPGPLATCRGSSPVPVRHRTSGLVPSLIQREILLETSGARKAKPGSGPSHGAIHERRLRSRGLSWYNSPKGGGDSRRKRRGWAAPGARRETRSPPARRLIIRKGAGDSRPPGQR